MKLIILIALILAHASLACFGLVVYPRRQLQKVGQPLNIFCIKFSGHIDPALMFWTRTVKQPHPLSNGTIFETAYAFYPF